MNVLEILKFTRNIVKDGGDPDPCELGQYCLRCCISIARTELDSIHGTEVLLGTCIEQIVKGFVELPEDKSMMESIKLVAAEDSGKIHTKSSALRLLDKVISDFKS